MYSGKIDNPQKICIKALGFPRGWTGKAALWIMGERGWASLGQGGEKQWPVSLFIRKHSGLAAGGLGPVLAGTQESKQFIPFSESHFSHLCNNRNQATMDEIIGFKQFPFSHGILYSNGVLQRINQNLYEE